MEDAHSALLADLRERVNHLTERVHGLATQDDMHRVEAKLDGLASKALDSAPPWAVRRIGALERLTGAGIAGAVAVCVSWIGSHFAHG